jgi:hypothetical protein
MKRDTSKAIQWLNEFEQRYGYRPTKLWIDREEYREWLVYATRYGWPLPAYSTLSFCAIPVYER